MQLCFFGNAYALIDRNSAGDVISLLPLPVSQYGCETCRKKVVYRYQRDSEYADFSQREIFHLKGFGFTGLVGLSPIAFACKSAGVAVAMEDQQRDFFANGAKSPQILMTGDRVLTEPQRNQLEENFKEIAGGPVKRLWILEAGFTTSPIGVTPQDAEMMASRKFRLANWRDSLAYRLTLSAMLRSQRAGAQASSSKISGFYSTPYSPISPGGKTAFSVGLSRLRMLAGFTLSIILMVC